MSRRLAPVGVGKTFNRACTRPHCMPCTQVLRARRPDTDKLLKTLKHASSRITRTRPSCVSCSPSDVLVVDYDFGLDAMDATQKRRDMHEILNRA